MCSYIYRRGAMYCTRLAVPPRLRPIIGKSDLGRSLRTRDLAEAKRLLPAWLEEAQAILAAAESRLAKQQGSDVGLPMTQAEADWQAENDRFWRQTDIEDEAKLEAAEAFEARLGRPDADLSDDEAAAALLLREAREERDRYRVRYRRRKQRDEQGGKATPAQATVPTFWNSRAAGPAVTITGIFEGYAAQEGSKPTTVKQFRSIINHLVAFLGHDDAKAVGLPDLVRWREHLRTEPVKGDKPRSAKTINDSYLAVANAVFAYGINQLLIDGNPATGLAKVRVR